MIHKRYGIEDWRIKRRAFERIAKSTDKPIEGFASRMEGDRPTHVLRDLPQIVDSVTMIGMVVGNDDGCEVRGFGIEQLLAKIGPAIDQ